MTKKKINLGMIGFGSWGKRVFYRLKKNKNIKILFIETKNNDFSNIYHKVDWIYIATPTSNHFEQVKKFLSLKLNVLCEKPLSFKKQELTYLYDLAKKNKKKLFINHIEFFKIKKEKFSYKKNNVIENYYPFYLDYSESFSRLLYHDFYLLYDCLKNKSFNLRLINQKDNYELEIKHKNSVQKIKSSLFEKKKRIHKINYKNLVTKKDYINEYFNSIFTGRESYLINKKQVFFVSKIYDKFQNILKKNRFILLNDLNNKFNLSKKKFLKDQSKLFLTQDFIKSDILDKLNEKLKNFVNRKYSVTVNTCSDGLYIALRALNIKEKDEVIVTSLSWISTASSILQCKAKPVFCDVEKNSSNIDFDKVEKLINKKTKAIIFVNLYGNLCNIKKLNILRNRYKKISFIEDCAQSFGSSIKIKDKFFFSGSFGDISCTSFYPTKNLSTIGDGGAIFTDDKILYEKIKNIAKLGQKKRLEVDDLGINSRMNSIQAIMILSQIKYMKLIKENLKKKYQFYINLIKKYNINCRVLKHKKSVYPHHLNFCIYLNKDRNKLSKFLLSKNIETGINYEKILPDLKIFKKYVPTNYKKKYKNSAILAASVLNLPFYYNIKSNDQIKVVKEISNFQKINS